MFFYFFLATTLHNFIGCAGQLNIS
jgi:hypothetical protein